MSSKKTKTTQTTTPTNPEWVTSGQQAFSDRTQALLAQDPRQFVAGPSELQQQQFGLAGQLGGQAQGWLNQAASMANPQISAAQGGPAAHAAAQTAYQGIGNYLNPYTSYVAGNTLNDLGRGLSIAQTGNGRDALLAGQYGGSRQGVVDANLNRDFFDRAGSTLGNLYAGGYNTALGASNQDADRAQQTSIFNAGADNTLTALNAQLQQQTSLANQGATQRGAELLSGLGQFGLGNLQNAAGAQYGINQAQAQAPLTTLQQLGAINAGIPYNLFNGQTVTGTGSTSGNTVDKIGQGVQIASKVLPFILSDGRLKRDIETVGYDSRGRRWVDFHYLWDPPAASKRRGIIAQELLDTDPQAVAVHPTGVLMVDYSQLED